jgi:RES domain-containing protein
MLVWRLFPGPFRSTAFTGVGGLYTAGRWNQIGVAVVYTATSRALAALEFFVNLEPNEAPDGLLIAEVAVPDKFVVTLDLALLPPNWRRLNDETCRKLGSDWVASRSSLALKVPSAVVEDEWNILLNPRHPKFAQVEIAGPKPFRYDARMFR